MSFVIPTTQSSWASKDVERDWILDNTIGRLLLADAWKPPCLDDLTELPQGAGQQLSS